MNFLEILELCKKYDVEVRFNYDSYNNHLRIVLFDGESRRYVARLIHADDIKEAHFANHSNIIEECIINECLHYLGKLNPEEV